MADTDNLGPCDLRSCTSSHLLPVWKWAHTETHLPKGSPAWVWPPCNRWKHRYSELLIAPDATARGGVGLGFAAQALRPAPTPMTPACFPRVWRLRTRGFQAGIPAGPGCAGNPGTCLTIQPPLLSSQPGEGRAASAEGKLRHKAVRSLVTVPETLNPDREGCRPEGADLVDSWGPSQHLGTQGLLG